MPTAQILTDRHFLITVTPRLTFIGKSLIRKPENRWIALYAGFSTLEAAEDFAWWVMEYWCKSDFDVTIRPGQRTQSNFEVKVRRPSNRQLGSLIRKAVSDYDRQQKSM